MWQRLLNWFREVPVSALLDNQNSADGDLAEKDLDEVRASQIELLYEMDAGAGYRPLIAFFVTTLFLSGFSSPLAWAAFGLYCGVSVSYKRLHRLYNQASKASIQKHHREWAGWFVLISALSGFAWGFGSAVWFNPLDVQNQAIVCMIIIGIGASSIISRAIHIPSLVAFMVPSTLPIILSLLLTMTPTGAVLAGLAVIFCSGLYGWGKTLNRWQLDSIALRFQNKSLVASLSRQKEVANEARKEAESGNRAKTEFLATMSHEVRTPLNGILGMARVLQLSDLDEEQEDYLDVITQSGESLSTILNDILDLSRMDAGRLDVTTEPFEALASCEGVVKLFGSNAAEKNLNLFINRQVDQATQAQGDAHRVRQILVNLIGNAIKFTDQGSVEISFGRHGSLQLPKGVGNGVSASEIIFAVTDTGIGIPPSAQETLFEAFRQADQSTTRKYGGSGLGLAICKRLVDLMGGKIGVVSETGEGSTFWFSLPAALPKTSEDKSSSAARKSNTAVSPRNKHILLAEDNDINAKVATAILTKAGHIVSRAHDGQEAIDIVTQDFERSGDLPDLILMDIRMPVLSGPEAAQALRDFGGSIARVPIFALSADMSATDSERLNNHNSRPVELEMFDHVLAKPISMESLEQAFGGQFKKEISMDQFGPDDPRYDASHLSNLLSTLGPETFSELLGAYEEDLQKIEAGLEQALSQGDNSQARQFAHNLVGASANLGFSALADAARALQMAAGASDQSAMVTEKETVFIALENTKQAIQEFNS